MTASYHRGKVIEFDKLVRLAPQFVSHHRRRGLDGADHRDAEPAALHRLDQPAGCTNPPLSRTTNLKRTPPMSTGQAIDSEILMKKSCPDMVGRLTQLS